MQLIFPSLLSSSMVTSTYKQLRNWCIALHDPISVLQIFQQGWYADEPSLIRQFLCGGILLNTFLITWPQDAIPLPLELAPPPPLTRVSIQLDLCTTDYGTCNTFLAHPYAHAALLKGRIVGCLVKEYLNIASVTEDPFQDVFMFWTSLCSSDGHLFWDNDIDNSEMDLIFGVYKAPTGQGMQTANVLVAETSDLGGL